MELGRLHRSLADRGDRAAILVSVLACALLLSCDPTTWVKIGYPTGPDEDDTSPYVTGIWLGSGGAWYGIMRNFAYYSDASINGLEGSTIDNVWIDIMNVSEGSSAQISISYPDQSSVAFNGEKLIAYTTASGHGTYALLTTGDFTPFVYHAADTFGLRVTVGGSTILGTQW